MFENSLYIVFEILNILNEFVWMYQIILINKWQNTSFCHGKKIIPKHSELLPATGKNWRFPNVVELDKVNVEFDWSLKISCVRRPMILLTYTDVSFECFRFSWTLTQRPNQQEL